MQDHSLLHHSLITLSITRVINTVPLVLAQLFHALDLVPVNAPAECPTPHYQLGLDIITRQVAVCLWIHCKNRLEESMPSPCK